MKNKKEGLVYKSKNGFYELQHTRSYDGFGFLRDYFEIIFTQTNGFKNHYPFIGKIKINKNNYLDMTNDYTKKEYKEMLEERISKMNS